MTKHSKPSALPNPASVHEKQGEGLLIPQPGDVLHYSYLWSHEADRGEEEGRKDRPAAVVAAIQTDRSDTLLAVLPITHAIPKIPSDAIEIPNAVKKDLGLDDERSWVVLTELNRFIWPGPDIRPLPQTGSAIIGALPDWLFLKVREAFVSRQTRRDIRHVKRTT